MRIALVTNSFPTLSETFIYNHAACLQAAGLDVTVVAARASADAAKLADYDGTKFTGPVVHAILTDRAPTTAAHFAAQLARGSLRGLPPWRAAIAHYGMTARAVRACLLALPLVGFDIVHFEYTGLAIAWRDALPLLAGTRIVTSCRGAAEQITPFVDPKRAPLLRELFARVDRVHCVSDDMKATCVGYGLDPTRAFVNRPAIDARRFQRATPYPLRTAGPFQLLSTGRLHWKKGLIYALQAVRALVDRGVDVHYTILGGGAEEEHLRFSLHDLGLADRVELVGKRTSTEVRAALESCDVYLLPSTSEGLSNAALEAMAMELPVVSTTAGGMAEAITSGVDGVLVPSRDPAALASQIAWLLEDAPRRAELGRAARRRIEAAFTLQRQIAVYLDEYAALMSAPPRV